MTPDSTPTDRRGFLRAAGVAALSLGAGCSVNVELGGSDDTETTRTTQQPGGRTTRTGTTVVTTEPGGSTTTTSTPTSDFSYVEPIDPVIIEPEITDSGGEQTATPDFQQTFKITNIRATVTKWDNDPRNKLEVFGLFHAKPTHPNEDYSWSTVMNVGGDSWVNIDGGETKLLASDSTVSYYEEAATMTFRNEQNVPWSEYVKDAGMSFKATMHEQDPASANEWGTLVIATWDLTDGVDNLPTLSWSEHGNAMDLNFDIEHV